ncbi:FAD/NAD(P)-binding protein [Caulobacter sp. UNC358MFTsu5.1]|uniref:FAD/NAD(P)-binding protein n=1 Tax=Caulobacter sp. UNC358MFTsu5.1 TaxID=1449049 RepID=UPI0004A70EBF|nr:FAD/NAD(P)-binding protein [Caulobacter sp. UNC358MFTsu5.1]
MDSPPVVAVIGAGFSGVMTALHLLRQSDRVKVPLIERRSPIGLGPAYATDDPAHRLNVRAGNMSAWPDRPDDFALWLKDQALDVGPGGFATRGDYGRYLQRQLASLAGGPEAVGRLLITPDEITAIAPDGDGWTLTCGMGRPLAADAVVLALGNPPPRPPDAVGPDLEASDAYVADPWRWDPATAPAGRGPILLLGSGLTMIDAALSLDRLAPGRPLIALSRRGLTPREHLGEPPSPLPAPPDASLSPVQAVAWLRAAADQHGWRTAIDALRPASQDLWRGWSLKRRAAFLRHARAFWDVHRHRLSPQIAEQVARMRTDGRLRVLAGKLERVDVLEGGRAGAVWRPRGETDAWRLEADLVVNCTGPSADVERSTEPLLAALADRGLIRADPLRLGLDIDSGHRVIHAGGRPHATLFAVGPITRGALWEINAVPDIRVQAVQVAAAVLGALERA